jgi:Holliday junction resolvase RusA-like endonuclease
VDQRLALKHQRDPPDVGLKADDLEAVPEIEDDHCVVGCARSRLDVTMAIGRRHPVLFDHETRRDASLLESGLTPPSQLKKQLPLDGQPSLKPTCLSPCRARISCPRDAVFYLASSLGYGTFGTGEFDVLLKTFALGLKVTRQAFVNDGLGMFPTVVRSLQRRIPLQENAIVYFALFLEAYKTAKGATSKALVPSVNLLAAPANEGAAFTPERVDEAKVLMTSRTLRDATDAGMTPRYLVVAPKNESKAINICGADSPACVEWKVAIIAAIVEAGWIAPPVDVPLELEIELALPTIQRARVGRLATGRPDLNNLAKAASDALMAPSSCALIAAARKLQECRSYAGVVADDAAIVRLIATKRWSLKPGGCRIILRDAV